MKLFTFEINDQRHVGAEWEGQLVDLSTAYNASLGPTGPKSGRLRAIPSEMPSFIRLERLALEAAADALAFIKRRPAVPVGEQLFYPFDSVKILPPMVRPGKILSFENISTDVAGSDTAPIPAEPLVFAKLPNTVIGPGDAIIKPTTAERILCGARLAAIVGKPLKRAAEADPLSSIFGYSIMNDVSADIGVTPGTISRNFDTFCPFGPCIVTADEFANFEQLHVRTRISGAILSETVMSHWRAALAKLLAYLSQVMTLDPGDVVCLNIPIQAPNAAAQATFLDPGSIVAIEILPVGSLENPIIAEEAP